MMVYNAGFLSAGDVIPKEPDNHDVLSTLDFDQKPMLNQLNQMNPISMKPYNTRSSSTGDIVLEEPDKHDITLHCILLSRS